MYSITLVGNARFDSGQLSQCLVEWSTSSPLINLPNGETSLVSIFRGLFLVNYIIMYIRDCRTYTTYIYGESVQAYSYFYLNSV